VTNTMPATDLDSLAAEDPYVKQLARIIRDSPSLTLDDAVAELAEMVTNPALRARRTDPCAERVDPQCPSPNFCGSWQHRVVVPGPAGGGSELVGARRYSARRRLGRRDVEDLNTSSTKSWQICRILQVRASITAADWCSVCAERQDDNFTAVIAKAA